MKIKIVLMTLLVAIMTMGFSCINDNYQLAINIQGLSGTYHVNRGDNTFGPPADSCRVVKSSAYLSSDFGTLGNVRIYDLRLSTIGSFAGNGSIIHAEINVNGVPILEVNNQLWSAFATPQSIFTSPFVTRDPNGIATLINAIRNKLDITICPGGSLSSSVTQDDLYLKVEVFGQVDGRP